MESSPNMGKLEKQKILQTRLSYQAQTVFIVNNYNKLKGMLDKGNYQKTLTEIDNLGRD